MDLRYVSLELIDALSLGVPEPNRAESEKNNGDKGEDLKPRHETSIAICPDEEVV